MSRPVAISRVPPPFTPRQEAKLVDAPNRPKYRSELFRRGLKVRRDMPGGNHVDGSLARAGAYCDIPAAAKG